MVEGCGQGSRAAVPATVCSAAGWRPHPDRADCRAAGCPDPPHPPGGRWNCAQLESGRAVCLLSCARPRIVRGPRVTECAPRSSASWRPQPNLSSCSPWEGGVESKQDSNGSKSNLSPGDSSGEIDNFGDDYDSIENRKDTERGILADSTEVSTGKEKELAEYSEDGSNSTNTTADLGTVLVETEGGELVPLQDPEIAALIRQMKPLFVRPSASSLKAVRYQEWDGAGPHCSDPGRPAGGAWLCSAGQCKLV